MRIGVIFLLLCSAASAGERVPVPDGYGGYLPAHAVKASCDCKCGPYCLCKPCFCKPFDWADFHRDMAETQKRIDARKRKPAAQDAKPVPQRQEATQAAPSRSTGRDPYRTVRPQSQPPVYQQPARRYYQRPRYRLFGGGC